MNLDNCLNCKESRCILSKYFGLTNEQIQEKDTNELLLKTIKAGIKEKMEKQYKKNKDYWIQFKERELKLVNYDRKPYMNESDWRHDQNWFLAIQELMRIQESYYNELEKLTNKTLDELLQYK